MISGIHPSLILMCIHGHGHGITLTDRRFLKGIATKNEEPVIKKPSDIDSQLKCHRHAIPRLPEITRMPNTSCWRLRWLTVVTESESLANRRITTNHWPAKGNMSQDSSVSYLSCRRFVTAVGTWFQEDVVIPCVWTGSWNWFIFSVAVQLFTGDQCCSRCGTRT